MPVLSAHVIPGSTINDRYHFSFDGCSVTSSIHGGLVLTKELTKANFATFQSSVKSIQSLTLALFLADRIPRTIKGFDHDGGDFAHSLALGNPISRSNANPRADEVAPFMQDGWMANRAEIDAIHGSVPDQTEIEAWYNLISDDDCLFGSLGMLQDAFARINIAENPQIYRTEIDLGNTIVLLVAGLEALFTRNADTHADIGFKFGIVGALFYNQYASSDWIESHVNGGFKIPFSEFKKVLGALYSLRSMVAHGRVSDLFKARKGAKEWKKLIQTLRIGGTEKATDMPYIFCIFALSRLQIHLFALFHGAGEKLKLGVNIIDSIVEPEDDDSLKQP